VTAKLFSHIDLPFRTIVLVCLAIAFALAASMAFSSSFDRHPDELFHFLAARYYEYHFFPPEIGDPAVRETYSVWGVSYLNFQWIEYFLAGKFMLIGPLIERDPRIAARCFQLFLFAALGGFLLTRSTFKFEATIAAAFLLITPQVWYVFSYVNNDAFALAVAFLIAYQLAADGSLINRFLNGEGVSGGVIAGLLIGVLLICKTNYWAFLIFVALWLVSRFGLKAVSLKRYALIACVAFAVVGFRIGLDLYVNGETNFVGASYISYISGSMTSNGAKLAAYQEEIADPRYKPSVIDNDLANTPADVHIADKGAPFTDIFAKWGWHRISFYSFTGVYGYMTIFGPRAYYNLMALIYLAFSIYLAFALIRARERQALIQLAITTLCAIICVLSSAYLSWTYAFQAQGRYLFPILPMAGVLVAANRRSVNNKILLSIFLIAFAASVYSFVFVGLRHIG